MRNEIGFVPKNYPLQPDYYKEFFGAWAAVFLTSMDEVYYLEMVLDHRSRDNIQAIGLEILKQTTECRKIVHHSIKNLRKGIELMEAIIEKENSRKTA